jgi:kumamolisin
MNSPGRGAIIPVLMMLTLVAPAVRRVQAADEAGVGGRSGGSPSVLLRAVNGNTPPGLARAALVGHADPDLPIHVTISLDLRDRAGAEALLASQHDPQSVDYNHWVTPEEFQARFGPLPEDVEAAEEFLVSRGFTDIQRPASRMVTGTGTVGMAETAFGVTINDYLYNGRAVYSNDRDPVLPSGLASKVVRVGGLDSLTRRFPAYSSSGGTLYYTHRDWANAYGELPTFEAGSKGAPGVTVAIAGSYRADVTRLNDIFTREGGSGFGYQAWTEAASGPRTLFQVCDVTGTVQGSKGCDLNDSGAFSSLEAQLDAVMISSTANDVHLVNHMVENQLVDSFTTMYQIIADDAANTKVVSTSWGLCVGNTPDSTIASDEAAFLQADAAGQAWFASSGDGGSNDCGGSPNPDTDWPASSTHVTGAGGSDMTDNFDASGWNQGHAGEVACSDGGGGIPSKSGPTYDRPTWQTGPGVPAGTKRLVPDISAHYGTCTGAANAAYAVTLGSFIFQTSGTSAVAPMWAGAWAVGNQVVGQNMGHAAPLLYRILRSEGGTTYAGSFYDIISGSNGAYSAGAGYDLTTGIGTPKWNGLFADLSVLFSVSTGNLQGTVTEGGSGHPISGATVTTSGAGGNSTTTNAGGFYTFTNISTGAYSVTASAPGFAASTATGVVVTVGGTTTHDFSLAANLSGCLTDTTQSDFQAGVPSGLDLISSPGDARLASTGGAETLDQQQNTLGSSGNIMSTSTWNSQTFVPGITGTLTKIDVHMFCSGCSGANPAVTVDVRTTSGGAPTNTVLASTTIPGFGSATDGVFSAMFATPASVSAGTTYAYVLRLTTDRTAGSYAATRSNNNQYSNGAFLISTNSGSTWSSQGSDLGFKTYVTTAPVYATTGSLASSLKDANPTATGTPHWTSLSWTAAKPANTAVAFQLAASNSPSGPFSFVGPDGTSATFFTTSPASLPGASFAGRYLKYRALLSTTNTAVTPTLSDVTVCYDNTCFGLANGTVCNDGDSCTTLDTCQSGACTGGPPADQDGDSHAAAICGGDDCDDMDPLVWFTPVEVTQLGVTGPSPTNLTWDTQGSLVGPETSYDLVSGSLPGGAGFDFSSTTCLQPDGGVGYTDTRPDPPADSGFWYLARARNSCGIGTYGTTLRDSSISSCP